MKYFIYIRRSSDREDRQTLSIEAQMRELKKIIQKDELEVVDVFTESQSAYKTGRLAFSEMLERIELGQADGIIAWQANRLARNSLDGGRLIYMMDEGKLKEIRTATKVFSTSGNDKFFLQIEFGMAKKSSDDTSDYMKRNAKSKLLKGEWPGMAPIGYLNIDKNGKIAGKFYDHDKQTLLHALGRPLKRIEIDPVVGPLMRKFFEYYLQEVRSLKEARDCVNNLGVRSLRKRRKFSTSMVERVLRNPFFAGKMRYEGEIVDGVHDGIVTQSEFNEIQERLSARKHVKTVKQEFLYRGLIKCGECGCSIVGTRKIKKSGGVYVYYGCSKRRGNCSQRPLKPQEIDLQVEERLQAVSINERVWKLCKKLLRLHFEDQIKEVVTLKEQWQKQVAQSERKIEHLLDLYLSEGIPKNDYIDKKNELVGERDLLKEKILDADRTAGVALENAEQFFGNAHAAYEVFKHGTMQQKKRMINTVGSDLVLTGGKLAWEYRTPFNFLVEQKKADRTVGNEFLGLANNQKITSQSEVIFWRTGRDSNPRTSP